MKNLVVPSLIFIFLFLLGTGGFLLIVFSQWSGGFLQALTILLLGWIGAILSYFLTRRLQAPMYLWSAAFASPIIIFGASGGGFFHYLFHFFIIFFFTWYGGYRGAKTKGGVSK